MLVLPTLGLHSPSCPHRMNCSPITCPVISLHGIHAYRLLSSLPRLISLADEAPSLLWFASLAPSGSLPLRSPPLSLAASPADKPQALFNRSFPSFLRSQFSPPTHDARAIDPPLLSLGPTPSLLRSNPHATTATHDLRSSPCSSPPLSGRTHLSILTRSTHQQATPPFSTRLPCLDPRPTPRPTRSRSVTQNSSRSKTCSLPLRSKSHVKLHGRSSIRTPASAIHRFLHRLLLPNSTQTPHKSPISRKSPLSASRLKPVNQPEPANSTAHVAESLSLTTREINLLSTNQ